MQRHPRRRWRTGVPHGPVPHVPLDELPALSPPRQRTSMRHHGPSSHDLLSLYSSTSYAPSFHDTEARDVVQESFGPFGVVSRLGRSGRSMAFGSLAALSSSGLRPVVAMAVRARAYAANTREAESRQGTKPDSHVSWLARSMLRPVDDAQIVVGICVSWLKVNGKLVVDLFKVQGTP